MMNRFSARMLGMLAVCGLLAGCNLNKEEPAPPPAPVVTKPAPAPVMGDPNWESMAFPTGDRATSTILLERQMPREVVVGQDFCYKFRVTNLTNIALSSVVLRDEISPNFSISKTNPQAQVSGSNITFNLGAMAPREQRIIEICGKATGPGRISSCAVVDWNSTLCAETNVVQPALKVDIAMPPERSKCDEICATGTVTNTGTGVASNVVVNVPAPAGLVAVGGTSRDVGTLAAGQSKPFTVCFKPERTGTFAAQATANAAGGLSASSGTAQTVVKQANLDLAIMCPQGSTFIGRTLSYEAVVTNKGDGAANNTMLMVTTGGASVASASDGGSAGAGGINWNLGTIAPGQSRKVSFVLNPGAAFTGNVAVSAKATAVCANEPAVNCTAQVIGIPAQLLDGVDNPDPVQVGNTTTYTLRVTNQGSQPLTNVKLMGKLINADKMQYVSTTGPAGNGQTSGADVTFPAVPTLAPGQSVTYTVVVKATGEGQVSFEAQTSSDQITVPLIKRETTNFFK